MKTSMVAALLTAAAALVTVAFLARSWRALALVVPILLYLGIGAMLAPQPLRIEATRTISRDRAAVGQPVDVRLRLTNRGPRVASLEVLDDLPEPLEVTKGASHGFLTLAPRASVDLAYTVVPRIKGEYAIGPVVLRAADPLGLRYEESRLAVEDRLVAVPRMEDLRRVRIVPRRVRSPMGSVRSRQVGPGLEFFSIRDYVPGDETRHVNWKASARLDRLFTNEYEAERSGDAVIILDARSESEVGPLPRSTVELGVTAAVSMAAKILDARNRCGLIVQRALLDWVYPGYGRRQLYRIVDALLRVRPGGEWSLEHVAWVFARFFPPDAQLIIVSPLLDRKAVDVIADLRARGLDVLVVSPSPIEVERAMHGEDPLAALAYRVLRMERDALIQSLRGYADVVDWNPERPLAVALQGVRPYPRRR